MTTLGVIVVRVFLELVRELYNLIGFADVEGGDEDEEDEELEDVDDICMLVKPFLCPRPFLVWSELKMYLF